MTLPFDPRANIFPLIEGDAFKDLCASIATKWIEGENVVLHEGKVLDGRNRYRGLIKNGMVRPDQTQSKYFRKFDPATEGDPLAFVIAKNMHRRHLDENQRAYVAAKIANISNGGDRRSQKRQAKLPGEVSQDAAAKLMTISPRSLRSAKVVLEKGEPALQKALERGKISVSVAEKAAKMTPAIQKQIAEEAEAGRSNVVRAVVKRNARADKEKRLAVTQKALPDKRYGVICDDPEWQYEVFSRETGLDRAADNHYPTSDIATLTARDVGKLAAKDCARFTWVTVPFLALALKMLDAQDFTYKSHAVWRKVRKGKKKGTGFWWWIEHELLVLSVRGAPPAPARGKQWDSVIDAPVGEHSEKPQVFYDMIEEYFPNLPKIELNARGPRDGWDVWGNEAEGESE
jgi:N6-adenosine-specific RNA methylase IME4